MTTDADDTPITLESLLADGWVEEPDQGFLGLIGPILVKVENDAPLTGILTDKRHANRRGVVQGGLIATLADRSLGHAARHDDPDLQQATVQLDIHYLDATRLGEFLVARCKVQRRTRSLIFVSGQIEANGRLVASAVGIFKILAPRAA